MHKGAEAEAHTGQTHLHPCVQLEGASLVFGHKKWLLGRRSKGHRSMSCHTSMSNDHRKSMAITRQ